MLEAGTRLGVYDIHSALGAGGMGEVYSLVDDPEREAQLLAALKKRRRLVSSRV